MDLAGFLSDLQRHSLPTECRADTGTAADADVAALHVALGKLDEAVRLDRPEELPELDLHAAVWATQQMHSLWVALATSDEVLVVPTHACPSDTQSPSTHFSVDLVLRHLPHLAERADILTADDARRKMVHQLAVTWPLSSVGIDGVNATSVATTVTTLLRHDGLRRSYAERILRRRDTSRQQDENVRLAVADVMAEHRNFATEVLAVHDELIKQRPQ
ncbi:MAG: hypothetical protein ACI9SE_000390 [Neolewinella sp.]|jgi:hypothetical protein